MKKNELLKTSAIFVIAIVLTMMTSCDSNPGKIKELAEQFATAINEKDKVTCYELYPVLRKKQNVFFVDGFGEYDIDIDTEISDSLYSAKINDKYKLIFKVVGDKQYEIIDSYNVLKVDSGYYDLAAKAAVPMKQISDLTIDSLFSDDGLFIKYLSELYPAAANGNLVESNGMYTWRGGAYPSCYFTYNITNKSDKDIKGEDYDIEIIVYRRNDNKEISRVTENGVFLRSGGSMQLITYDNIVYKEASKRNIYCKYVFKFKSESRASTIAKYATFDGTEWEKYQNYLSLQKEDGGFAVTGEWNNSEWKYVFVSWKGQARLIFDDNEVWQGRLLYFDKNTGDMRLAYSSTSGNGSLSFNDFPSCKINDDNFSFNYTYENYGTVSFKGKLFDKSITTKEVKIKNDKVYHNNDLFSGIIVSSDKRVTFYSIDGNPGYVKVLYSGSDDLAEELTFDKPILYNREGNVVNKHDDKTAKDVENELLKAYKEMGVKI